MELRATVERQVYRNDDTGWTVLDIAAGDQLVKAVGTLPPIGAGETLVMEGEWVDHPTFGPQFRIERFERQLPQRSDGILRYLSSGVIKGVGAATAARIVKKFGADALRVMEEEPERLREIKGISPDKAKQIAAAFAEQCGLREIILAFSPFGLTANEAVRCWKLWQSEATARIRANPYLLYTHGLSVGFEKADAIARSMEHRFDSPFRLAAGLLYVLRHNAGNGHTCLPADRLAAAAAEMLGCETARIEDELAKMLAAQEVRQTQTQGRRMIFLPHYYNAEWYIARRIREMMSFVHISHSAAAHAIERLETQNGIRYEQTQRIAITEALDKGALILTGGPGTGKTTTLKAIISILDSAGETVAVAAPTGRAAKRISELTGFEAKTIHRLLEVKWSDEERAQIIFDRNESNPLDIDTLVVDELSMVDVMLFEGLLRALKLGCRLILVGDCDQLPPVGAGCVLHDLIRAGAMPVVQLTEVFRQAQESRIITNAHRIVSGQNPNLDAKEGDFFFLARASEAQTAQTVTDLCLRRLPERYGYGIMSGIQVLCPGKRGELGTRALNTRLQELVNPPDELRGELMTEGVRLRVGDKVMHTRNNYDICWTRDNGETGSGVFNGDIGILEAIDTPGGTLTVRFDDRRAVYTRQDARDLDLAYAITIHKSQGSEFDAVILPLLRNPPNLCFRNLLYTAVTRARHLLIIVGSAATVAQMTQNDRKTLRYSGLQAFLLGE